MFRGEVSKGWEIAKLKELCKINPKKSELGILDNMYEVSFIPMTAVSEKGDIDASNIKHYGDVCKGFTYFSEIVPIFILVLFILNIKILGGDIIIKNIKIIIS